MLTALPEEADIEQQLGKVEMTIVPGSAFVLMWMDPSKPQLDDVAEAVRDVFKQVSPSAVVKALHPGEVRNNNQNDNRAVN
jgi:hypothetical protein